MINLSKTQIFFLQIYYKYMLSILKKYLSVILLFIYLSREVHTSWVRLKTGTINVPAHIFSISLRINETLTGSLTWNSTADLDIYVYMGGLNYLYGYSQSNSTSSQNFTFKSSSLQTYYIRVHSFDINSNKILPYNLKLTKSSGTVNYTGIFVENYTQYNAITISTPLQFTNIAFKYEAGSSLTGLATLMYQSSIINLSSYLALNLCNDSVSYVYNWTLIIKDTLSSTNSITPVTYNLSYYVEYPGCPSQCTTTQKWNNITKKCQLINSNSSPQTQSSNIPIIVISVVVPVVILIIIGISVFLWRRYKKKNVQNQIRENGQQLNNTNHQFKSEENCCICLGDNCNYMMKCKHIFHRYCIEAWLKKNSVCPLCRIPISFLR